ncbi:hypothetical protein JI739_00950 [Ramlibacter sp. AW1]|uniref:Uncharacterized protein n=1 Tax=Ramlibacter aurantiacus TaxID=2801330 RepID=A0A936ZDF5_9BURK|nr:hypothetical protein [Ramlibacter aurantiacus]MBL0418902.1 hypothetical protein [Ramlibacter aurantiacus]
MTHSSTPQGTGPFIGVPPPLLPSITETKHWFQAMDNFCRFMAIKAGDRVLMLTDPLLDPRVVDAFSGLAAARGATLSVYMAPDTRLPGIPETLKPLIQEATFVVSTWFCSIEDPFNVAMRKAGQRWVKITYFRDLDVLKTPQARFPVELVSEIIRATERRIPRGRDFDIRFTDERGSDLRIPFTAAMRDTMYAGLRWQGKISAAEPGCYAHYLPTHGPNFWDSTAMKNDTNAYLAVEGVLYPQWAIGFEKPFAEKIGVVFKDRFVTEVTGESDDAAVLREMLVGGKLIEGGGCGFNPKAPRNTIYPAGSNAPGALHFGIDLAKPSDFIRRVMPNWEEPPIHQDLVVLDATVTADDVKLIDKGFLMALRDPAVVELAATFGDPVELLEGSV